MSDMCLQNRGEEGISPLNSCTQWQPPRNAESTSIQLRRARSQLEKEGRRFVALAGSLSFSLVRHRVLNLYM